jgi:hypothetical protein
MQKGTNNFFIELPRKKHLLASFSFLIPTLINRNTLQNLPFFNRGIGVALLYYEMRQDAFCSWRRNI